MVVSGRSMMFAGMIHLVLSGPSLATEGTAEHWGTQPPGPKVETAPFRPAPMKREMRPTLKVNSASGAEIVLVQENQSANAAERMCAALNGKAIFYNNDTNLTQKTAWTEWVIPLQQFAGQGVNLSNVTSVTIGFGTRGDTTMAGGTSRMYFDDLRLYRPASAECCSRKENGRT